MAMSWTVGDVMTEEVVTVGPETDFKTCVDLLQTEGVSALPVVEGEYVVGIVSEHDLLLKQEDRGSEVHLGRRELNQARGRTARDVMHSPALCVGLGASLVEAARLMLGGCATGSAVMVSTASPTRTRRALPRSCSPDPRAQIFLALRSTRRGTRRPPRTPISAPTMHASTPW